MSDDPFDREGCEQKAVPAPARNPFLLCPARAFGKPVCRLGLATRGDSALEVDDVHLAIARGINFLNWPNAGDDALSCAVSELGSRRDDVVICAQFSARSAAEAAEELPAILAAFRTDHIDVLTFYYVEAAAEWRELSAPGGALGYCRDARRDGTVRRLGLTTHQRPLAAEIANEGSLDLLMLRYNAAHRGAERDVFPVTDRLGLPIIAYTGLRWGALLRMTPDDPVGFAPPRAPAWYRFVLQCPSVSVALMAPDRRAELLEDLTVLEADGPLPDGEYDSLAEHGRRVRLHGGGFP